MPSYRQYAIDGVLISEILEDSANRESTNISGYRVGNTEMSFAKYIPYYHPFTYNTNLNDYLKNNTNIDKDCCALGYAPIMQQRLFRCADDGLPSGAEVWSCDLIISYIPNGNNSGSIKIKHEMIYGYPNAVGESYYRPKDEIIECPNTFILVIQGSGGGGSGGGGFRTAKRCEGGGSGPCVVLNVEVPYNAEKETEIVSIKLGGGGRGGSALNNGSAGSSTTVTLRNPAGDRELKLYGGHGGKCVENTGNHAGDSSKPWGYTSMTGLNILLNTNYYGSAGNGRFSLNNAMKNLYRKYSSVRGYFPGTYISGDTYDYFNYTYSTVLPYRIASGINRQYSCIDINRDGYPLTQIGAEVQAGAIGGVSTVMAGTPSFMGKRGLWASSNGSNGGNGDCGAGGGGGGPATSFFDTGIGSGGKGGGAGVKIFW